MDIESEFEHWKSSIVCFVLGASPHSQLWRGLQKTRGEKMVGQSLWLAKWGVLTEISLNA